MSFAERVRGVFLENFFLKLISLGIAVSLYVYVRGDRAELHSLPVAVEYVGTPTGKVLVSTKVDQVTVTISAPWSPWRRIEASDIPKYVVDVTDGRNRDVPFDKSKLLPPGLRGTVEEVVPPSVMLRFEDRVDGEAPVAVEWSGERTRGFVPEATITPPRIGVSGGVSAISGLKSVVTAPVDVTGRTEGFEALTTLVEPPAGVVLRGAPKVVKVAVTFREVPVEKWYSGIPITAEGTDWDVEAEPAWVSMKLTGPVRVIDALDGSALRVVLDLRDEDRKGPGLYAKPLATATVRGLPEGRGVAVTAFSADAVKVVLGTGLDGTGSAAPGTGSPPEP